VEEADNKRAVAADNKRAVVAEAVVAEADKRAERAQAQWLNWSGAERGSDRQAEAVSRSRRTVGTGASLAG
jgi:hypothetical protein